MLVVGLTGGIGSGKSTVANLFSKQGVPIIDADVIARDVTQVDQPALKHIVARYGEQILHPDGTLNRAKLGKIIFNHSDERRWLESLLHPLIENAIIAHLQTLDCAYCIVVIPLLFEVDPYPFIQRILVVDTPRELQIARVTARDQLTPTQIENILNAQVSRTHRLTHADDVIENHGDLQTLAASVAHLHQRYLEIAATMRQ